MLADLIFIAVALIGVLAGSITDLKERIIPNWITYSMIAFGIGGHVILSLLNKSIWPIAYSLGAAGVFFVISMLMFYSGAWAGGDTKTLIGFGALIPIYPLVLQNWLNPNIAFWPFMFTLWINILIFGAIMGLLFGVYIIVKNLYKFIEEFKRIVRVYRLLIHLITFTALIPIAVYFFKLTIDMLVALIWVACAVFFYIFLLTKSVENISMYKTLSTKKLIEGDWIVEKVFSGNKLIYKPKRIGVVQEDIDKILKSGVKTVEVKEGIPMIPAYFIGLIVSLVFGDILFVLFNILLP